MDGKIWMPVVSIEDGLMPSERVVIFNTTKGQRQVFEYVGHCDEEKRRVAVWVLDYNEETKEALIRIQNCTDFEQHWVAGFNPERKE
jgi:hypothetical protein